MAAQTDVHTDVHDILQRIMDTGGQLKVPGTDISHALHQLRDDITSVYNITRAETSHHPSFFSEDTIYAYHPSIYQHRLCYPLIALIEFRKWAIYRQELHPSRLTEYTNVGIAYYMNVVYACIPFSTRDGIHNIITNMNSMWLRVCGNYVNDSLMRDIDMQQMQSAIEVLKTLRKNERIEWLWEF